MQDVLDLFDDAGYCDDTRKKRCCIGRFVDHDGGGSGPSPHLSDEEIELSSRRGPSRALRALDSRRWAVPPASCSRRLVSACDAGLGTSAPSCAHRCIAPAVQPHERSTPITDCSQKPTEALITPRRLPRRESRRWQRRTPRTSYCARSSGVDKVVFYEGSGVFRTRRLPLPYLSGMIARNRCRAARGIETVAECSSTSP